MRVGLIVVLYQTPKRELKRLEKEFIDLGFKDYSIYFIDNTINNRGFGTAVNEGLKKGLKDGVDIFIIANPDISFKNIKANQFFEAGKYFDLWGFSIQQGNEFFYGGAIDKWRLSGGLIREKPKKRFIECDFISGSLMVIKRKVVETIGFFKENYFLYYEDLEYCHRAKKNNFKVGIDSSLQYEHLERSKNNPKKEYFLFKNRWLFFWEYSDLKQKIRELFRLPLTASETVPLLIKLIFNSRFLRDFLSLNLSTLVNKIFHFFLFIFLIRHLSPSDYGLYTLVWAYLGFFNPFTDLGTTNWGLVYLPKSEKNTYQKLLNLRILIGFILFFVINFSAIFFFKNKEILPLIFFVSLTVFANIWSGTYLIINSIKQKVIVSSIISTAFNIFFVVLIIAFFLLFRTLWAIFLAVGMSFFLYCLINFYLVKREIGKANFEFDFPFWFEIFKKSILFVLISFFASLRFKTDVFLLNHFLSSKEVGIYSAGYKFLDALILIAGSYNFVAQPIFSRIIADLNALTKKIKKDLLFLAFISLSISLIFFIASPFFLPFFMVKKYQTGIPIARFLIFALPFVYINSIFYNTLYALNKIKSVLVIFVIQSIISLVINFYFIPKYSYYSPIGATIFSEFFSLILSVSFFFYYLKRAKNENRS